MIYGEKRVTYPECVTLDPTCLLETFSLEDHEYNEDLLIVVLEHLKKGTPRDFLYLTKICEKATLENFDLTLLKIALSKCADDIVQSN